jgi:hypothetical protein
MNKQTIAISQKQKVKSPRKAFHNLKEEKLISDQLLFKKMSIKPVSSKD